MNYFSGSMRKDSGFTQSDCDELKSVLEKASKVGWIELDEDTKTINFSTRGIYYLGEKTFDEFMNKHSSDTKLLFGFYDVMSFSKEYIVENGNVIKEQELYLKEDSENYELDTSNSIFN